jgi:hypothetical protein
MAPNGTAEVLVDAAMREANARGLTFVTLGLAPLAGGVAGGGRCGCASSGTPSLQFRGAAAFKAKLQPSRWDPVYVSFPREISAPARSSTCSRRSRAAGSCASASRRSRGGPTLLVTLLAFLLVPWTILLAGCRAQLVPAPGLQNGAGWRSYVLVAAGLFLLSRRWRPALARLRSP